jgi:hypothetical protein
MNSAEINPRGRLALTRKASKERRNGFYGKSRGTA